MHTHVHNLANETLMYLESILSFAHPCLSSLLQTITRRKRDHLVGGHVNPWVSKV